MYVLIEVFKIGIAIFIYYNFQLPILIFLNSISHQVIKDDADYVTDKTRGFAKNREEEFNTVFYEDRPNLDPHPDPDQDNKDSNSDRKDDKNDKEAEEKDAEEKDEVDKVPSKLDQIKGFLKTRKDEFEDLFFEEVEEDSNGDGTKSRDENNSNNSKEDLNTDRKDDKNDKEEKKE